MSCSQGTSDDTSGTASNSAASRSAPASKSLKKAMSAIKPFFRPMGDPKPGDWLAAYRESGQTFDEYRAGSPTPPTADRRTIYVQPFGHFTRSQNVVIKAATDYLAAFYGLPVKSLPGKRLPGSIGSHDLRMIDYPKHRQIRTGFILETLLKPALPADAAALIAFTDEDLYPDSSMYYVFGQASFDDRVGVWSLFRLEGKTGYDTFLRRTLKIAAHETGHMFSMRHCTKYECVMSGTNHLQETDSRPIDACPECMAKICWLMKIEPADRYLKLIEFCRKYGLKQEAEEFDRKLKAVEKAGSH
ncbi:MAG: archaemetzincin [Acidobacteriota bacterium]